MFVHKESVGLLDRKNEIRVQGHATDRVQRIHDLLVDIFEEFPRIFLLLFLTHDRVMIVVRNHEDVLVALHERWYEFAAHSGHKQIC